MTTYTPTPTDSERSARTLLAAWNSGDPARLEASLDRMPVPRKGGSSSEQERIEMVQEIAGSIRVWLAGAGWNSRTDLEASLRLLRHLAGCRPSSVACRNQIVTASDPEATRLPK